MRGHTYHLAELLPVVLKQLQSQALASAAQQRPAASGIRPQRIAKIISTRARTSISPAA